MTFGVLIFLLVIPRKASVDFQPAPQNVLPPAPPVSMPPAEQPQQIIANFSQDYDYAPAYQAPGTVRIPILAYHHIALLPPVGTAGRDLYVSPEMFDQQMAYLKQKSYRVVTTREYYELLKAGQNPVQKTVMLTFGDGNLDNYTDAFPILKKYGMVGNFFVISGLMHISSDQLKEMEAAGMVIEGHSMTHIALGAIIDPNILQREIVQSKADIEAMSGKPIFAILYPNCTYNDAVLNLVQANYTMALACGAQIDNSFDDRFHLQRTYVYDDFEDFKKRLSGIMEYVNQ